MAEGTEGFGKDFWERHWQDAGATAMGGSPPNPYLAAEAGGLTPGTALDAGCGAGAEALWLAARGWDVTAADISAGALARAAERAAAAGAGVAGRLAWVEADLSAWEPGRRFDLVMTHYAHPAMPQLEFYARIGEWVVPGGTLLIVGHLETGGSGGHGYGQGHGHGEGQPDRDQHGLRDQRPHDRPQHDRQHPHEHQHQHPAEASVTAASVTARLSASQWEIVTADERRRTLTGHATPSGHGTELHDVVVRATRRG